MPDRPTYIFVDEDPPADLVAAARRGECFLLHGARPQPSLRLARALVAWADGQIEREAGERKVALVATEGGVS